MSNEKKKKRLAYLYWKQICLYKRNTDVFSAVRKAIFWVYQRKNKNKEEKEMAKKENIIRSVNEALRIGEAAIITTMGDSEYRTSPVERIWRNADGSVSQIETKHTIYKIKNVILVNGCDMGSLKVGQSATVFCQNGDIVQTSPVENYRVSSKVVYIETDHTIYKNL